MKKLLYLFGTFLFILVSCSKDNTSSTLTTSNSTTAPSRDASVLVKQFISDGSDGTSVKKFNYDGNKIVSSTNRDGSKLSFTYTGDLISKINEINAQGIINKTTELIYANGKLVYEISKLASYTGLKTRYEYTYNSDNTVIYKRQDIDPVTGASIDSNKYGIGKYTFKDGNLVAEEYSFYVAGTVVPESVYSNTYEYDTKNNPLYNIVGYRLLLGTMNSANNLINSGCIQDSRTVHSSNSFVYNTNGFPILGTDQSGATTQYIY